MAILTWADMIWGKPSYFFHPKFTLLCMSILTLEQILIWVLVLVLVLNMKVLYVLKYFLKKWVLDQYLYLIYIWGTWCTWVLGQLYLTPTLKFNNIIWADDSILVLTLEQFSASENITMIKGAINSDFKNISLAV